MTLQEKKKKAAAIAVACFLQMEKEDSAPKVNAWGQMGKSRIMQGRQLMQSKGRVPGAARF